MAKSISLGAASTILGSLQTIRQNTHLVPESEIEGPNGVESRAVVEFAALKGVKGCGTQHVIAEEYGDLVSMLRRKVTEGFATATAPSTCAEFLTAEQGTPSDGWARRVTSPTFG